MAQRADGVRRGQVSRVHCRGAPASDSEQRSTFHTALGADTRLLAMAGTAAEAERERDECHHKVASAPTSIRAACLTGIGSAVAVVEVACMCRSGESGQ